VSETNPNYRFETLQLHAGQTPAPGTNARAVPIYQTTSYTFDDRRARRQAVRAAAVRQHLHPDHESDDRRLRTAHRGARRRRGGSGHGSGQAAQFLAITTIAQAGDNIVSTSCSTAAPTTSSRSPCRGWGST
jgi:O-acetylhomoserine/O-acetylserine sulfhydrylase